MVLPIMIEVAKTEVKSTKPYNFGKLYDALHDWFYEEDYADDYDAGFPEKYYWESRTQTMGKEYWIWWRCKKNISGNKLFRRAIDLDIHGVGVQDQEIMYHGKRVKINKGKFELIIRGKLEIDYEGKFRNSSWGFLFELFYRRLWRKELEIHKRELHGEVNKIHDFARDFMGMSTISRSSQPFYLRHGYEDDGL